MYKLVYIVTVSMTANNFLRGQLHYLRNQGFEVTLITSPNPELFQIAEREKINVIGIAMQREIHLYYDLISLWQLYKTLRKLKPDIVNAGTPKAGFLGMLAAWLARVPVRVYSLHGLRLETATGFKRSILAFTERIASTLAEHIVCVSPSLLRVYAKLKLADDSKLIFLGSGSANGLDIGRFLPNSTTAAQTEILRHQLKLSTQARVIGFVGRFTKDKGIIELFDAFKLLIKLLPNTYLLLVGRFEEGDPVPDEIVQQINSHPQIILVGFVADTSPYYHLMDILAFPSYREGLGYAPLEAAVAGVPTVGFCATGTVDAVQNGKTGILVPIGSTQALTDALLNLLCDQFKLDEMGTAAQQWAIQNFDAKIVWRNWENFYQQCIPINNSALSEEC